MTAAGLVQRAAASPRLASGRLAVLAVAAALAACTPAPPSPPSAGADGWHEFEGSWSATGTRQTLRLGSERSASTGRFSGSLLLSGRLRPAVGFRAEAIVFADSVSGMTGRAVWTDENGDQAFSELRGDGSAAGSRIVGRFVGGSGRYAYAEGQYEFRWRFLVDAEDGTVQGQSIDLKGRVRLAPPAAAAAIEGAGR